MFSMCSKIVKKCLKFYLIESLQNQLGESRISQSKQEFTECDAELLDKWQVAQKYREMIESIYVEEINGMNKHYTITLKEGFINDETGSRNQTEQ